MTDIIFESFINLFQSVVVTVFLIISLGCKDKYNKKCVSAAGILITFIYLTVSNHLVFFESVGIYVYMAYSLMFSFVILSGILQCHDDMLSGWKCTIRWWVGITCCQERFS